jgi:hypothetical protein
MGGGSGTPADTLAAIPSPRERPVTVGAGYDPEDHHGFMETKNAQVAYNDWARANGRKTIKEDGLFGQETKRALSAFKLAHGITSWAGEIDPDTRAALSGLPPPPPPTAPLIPKPGAPLSGDVPLPRERPPQPGDIPLNDPNAVKKLGEKLPPDQQAEIERILRDAETVGPVHGVEQFYREHPELHPQTAAEKVAQIERENPVPTAAPGAVIAARNPDLLVKLNEDATRPAVTPKKSKFDAATEPVPSVSGLTPEQLAAAAAARRTAPVTAYGPGVPTGGRVEGAIPQGPAPQPETVETPAPVVKTDLPPEPVSTEGAEVPLPPQRPAYSFSLPPADLDHLTRVVLAEARGEGVDGMRGVAEVALNRLENGGFGSSLGPILGGKYQFAKPLNINPNSALYKQARQAVEDAYYGNGPNVAKGATYFFNPKTSQRAAMAEIKGGGRQQLTTIGNHQYWGDPQKSASAGKPASAAAADHGLSVEDRNAQPAGWDTSTSERDRVVAEKYANTLWEQLPSDIQQALKKVGGKAAYEAMRAGLGKAPDRRIKRAS